MLIDGYVIEVEKAREWVKRNRLRRILIQSPPGLWRQARELAEELSQDLDEVLLYGGSCWGGCDLAIHSAKLVKADGIIHLGHARFLRSEPLPTLYLECRRADPKPILKLLEEGVDRLRGYRRIGLGMTVQWLDHLGLIHGKLRELGLEVFTEAPEPPLEYEGQILGCSYTPLLKLSNLVDCYLIIGSRFHGLGLALQTSKPVYSLDPELQKFYDSRLEAEKILRIRYAYIEEFRSVREAGVLVSIKPGQYRLGLASRVRSLLRRAGKYAEVLIMDDIVIDRLRDSGFEGFVNTACPRLSIEDQMMFEKPILLPAEAMIAVGERSWEEVVRTPSYFSMEV